MPEHELVYCAIRVDHTQDERLRGLLRQGLDWYAVSQVANRHQVIPLLYYRLKVVAQDLVPPVELAKLQVAYLNNSQQNLRLAQHLFRLLELFSSLGIEAIPLKGPALALQAYGDLSRRSYGDLDILIREKDFSRCYVALVGAGYTPDIPLAKKRQKWILTAYNFTFTQADHTLEIHWSLDEKFLIQPFPQRAVWDHQAVLALMGREFRVLRAEDLLLYLCLHGARHQWTSLKLIADLAHLVQASPPPDWPTFLRQVDTLGFQRLVGLGLRLAVEIGGLDLPEAARAWLERDPEIRDLADRVREVYLADNYILELGDLTGFLFRLRERRRDRTYYVGYKLFIPQQSDWLAVDLPPALYPLYYLLRPLRLAVQYGRRMFNAMVR